MLNMMKDTSMAIVSMPATPDAPVVAAGLPYTGTPSTKDVYLLVNNLPKPVPDKQYQLWTIVDGKPVDAGIFEIKDEFSLMKNEKHSPGTGFCNNPSNQRRKCFSTMPIYVFGKVTG